MFYVNVELCQGHPHRLLCKSSSVCAAVAFYKRVMCRPVISRVEWVAMWQPPYLHSPSLPHSKNTERRWGELKWPVDVFRFRILGFWVKQHRWKPWRLHFYRESADVAEWHPPVFKHRYMNWKNENILNQSSELAMPMSICLIKLTSAWTGVMSHCLWTRKEHKV